MSHFKEYECKATNVDYIQKALREMDLDSVKNQTMVDYFRQTRDAELVVTRNGQQLPIGWLRDQATKELKLEADWFATGIREKEFTSQISQLHSKYQVFDTCEENGWTIDLDTMQYNDQGELEIEAVQYA